VKLAHRNGEEELKHRSIKEFMGSEHLSFSNLGMNGGYYFFMVISHFLMESFRKDIARELIPCRCYASQGIIDIAVKIAGKWLNNIETKQIDLFVSTKVF
jgi:hypothetical protein